MRPRVTGAWTGILESIVCTCRCLRPGGGVKLPVALTSAMAAEFMDMRHWKRDRCVGGQVGALLPRHMVPVRPGVLQDRRQITAQQVTVFDQAQGFSRHQAQILFTTRVSFLHR